MSNTLELVLDMMLNLLYTGMYRCPLALKMTSEEKDDEIHFLVGTAISTYQNSGGPGTNWSDFEEQTYKGASRIFEVSNGTRPLVWG